MVARFDCIAPSHRYHDWMTPSGSRPLPDRARRRHVAGSRKTKRNGQERFRPQTLRTSSRALPVHVVVISASSRREAPSYRVLAVAAVGSEARAETI